MVAPKKTAPRKISNATIGKGFKDNIGRLAKTISKGKRNEDETRRWIIDVLKDALGYTEDDIETECAVLGKKADIVLMDGKDVLLVIECKSANIQIKQAAINQAANYALALSCEWAVVTNGQAWNLYHVEHGENNSPEIIELFSIELLDEDGVSKDDIDCLSLLTKKSILSGSTDEWFHNSRIVEPNRLYRAILSKPVINAITKELIKDYKKDYNVVFESLDDDYIKELISIWIESMNDE